MQPTARLDWRAIRQFAHWRSAWDARQIRYNPAYVNPPGLDVELLAGQSDGGGSPITSITWAVRGLEGIKFEKTISAPKLSFTTQQPSSAPGVDKETGSVKLSDKQLDELAEEALLKKFRVTTSTEINLPQEGKYRVKLTVKNEAGATVSTTKEFSIQEIFIVTIGDSMASGEGNPDILAEQKFNPQFPLVSLRNAVWLDERCHRSHFAGHALAAENLEDQDTVVTFLSYACSGAEIDEGLLSGYEGIEPPDSGAELPGQLQAVAQALGSDRKIDYLLVTAGVNNLGFSNYIKAAAIPDDAKGTVPFLDGFESEGRARFTVLHRLGQIDSLYDELAFALSRTFNGRIRQVVITEYPPDIFSEEGTRGGCGLFFNISQGEANFIRQTGIELNQKIQRAAERHGWLFVGGIAERFKRRGYCSGEPLYVALGESIFSQHDIEGTVHPNKAGHEAIGESILRTIQSAEPVERLPIRVTVTVEAVKVVDEPSQVVGQNQTLDLRVNLIVNGQAKNTPHLPVNQEVKLPENEFTFTGIVNNGLAGILKVQAKTTLPGLDALEEAVIDDKTPTGKRVESDPEDEEIPRDRLLQLTDIFTGKDGFGTGEHISRSREDRGFLEIRYRVAVRPEIKLIINPKLPARFMAGNGSKLNFP